MNTLARVSVAIIFASAGFACASPRPGVGEAAAQADTAVAFDSALAARLGADEYGMHQYVMAFLKAGPNRSQDSTTAAELQRAHLANISRMAREGTLVLAGPFLDDGEVRGIYVFNVESVDSARALTATDPAIKAGRLVMELHPWYGSAALQQVTAIHGRIARATP
ncbi:MAG TPA: YciI family protein [Gemmatimonadales bacterium]|nr:YciI family protein [Gemmatimonadales bacterium]